MYGLISEDYLMHHGVKGMKWGVRHDYVPVGRKRSGKASNSARKRGMSAKTKKRLKRGAIAAGIALGAVGGVYLAKSGKLDNVLKLGKNKTNDILGLEDDAIKTAANKILAPEEMLKASAGVNPTNSSTNCGSVSSCVLAKMLGYKNIQALPETPEHMRIPGKRGYDPDKLIKCFDGGAWTKIDAIQNRKAISKSLEEQLISQGNGSKGIFYFEGRIGGKSGHYFSYTIANNKVHVLEGQVPGAQKEGLVYNTNFYEEIGKLLNPELDVKFARLDNCPIKAGREKDLFKIL